MSALLGGSFSHPGETSSRAPGCRGKVSRPRARRPEVDPQSSLLPSPPLSPSPSHHPSSPGHSRDGNSLLSGSSTAHSLPSPHRGLSNSDHSTSCFPGHLNTIPSPHGSLEAWCGLSPATSPLTSCLHPFATYSSGYFTSSNIPSSLLSQGLFFFLRNIKLFIDHCSPVFTIK